MHILLPKNDNSPSWISGKERMTVENILWSNLHERMLPTQRGSNPQTPNNESDTHPTEPLRPAAITIWSEFCDLYANVQPIFLLYCKFQIIILKTIEVTETQTLLYHVYNAIFYVTLAIKIWVLLPLCTCPAYSLTIVQVSNQYLEDCRRSCSDTNHTMPCV